MNLPKTGSELVGLAHIYAAGGSGGKHAVGEGQPYSPIAAANCRGLAQERMRAMRHGPAHLQLYTVRPQFWDPWTRFFSCSVSFLISGIFPFFFLSLLILFSFPFILIFTFNFARFFLFKKCSYSPKFVPTFRKCSYFQFLFRKEKMFKIQIKLRFSKVVRLFSKFVKKLRKIYNLRNYSIFEKMFRNFKN